MSERQRVAVVGAGVSGLVAAHMLDEQCDVTVFEAANYPGGHTRTLEINVEGRDVAVDIGFIVFNDWTYPNFIALLDKLGVESVPTSMGFSMSDERSGLEYMGGTFTGLFAQRRNLVRPRHWRMLLDIKRFFVDGKRALDAGGLQQTLGEFLEHHHYGDDCVQQFVLPMAAAIWSTEPRRVRDFPAAFFLRFFENHGLLNINDRPIWRVVKGGSRRYVEKLLASFGGTLRLNDAVHSVSRSAQNVTVRATAEHVFDQVIFACHSDQALRLLSDASPDESAALGALPYQENDVVLHSDVSLLPKTRRAWAAWNYHRHRDQSDAATLTYNMNILQHLGTRDPLCVTLNARERIDPAHILHTETLAHPLYTAPGIEGQAQLNLLNGRNRTAFCGAYCGNGFHEDGVVSAQRAVRALGLGDSELPMLEARAASG